MELPDLLYHMEHTWARVQGGTATVGITEHAQEALGDIVYIDMPETGDLAEAGQELCEMGSTKATSAVISPLSGTVAEVNKALEDEPELLNTNPHGLGWIAVIELGDTREADELLDEQAYEDILEKGNH